MLHEIVFDDSNGFPFEIPQGLHGCIVGEDRFFGSCIRLGKIKIFLPLGCAHDVEHHVNFVVAGHLHKFRPGMPRNVSDLDPKFVCQKIEVVDGETLRFTVFYKVIRGVITFVVGGNDRMIS